MLKEIKFQRDASRVVIQFSPEGCLLKCMRSTMLFYLHLEAITCAPKEYCWTSILFITLRSDESYFREYIYLLKLSCVSQLYESLYYVFIHVRILLMTVMSVFAEVQLHEKCSIIIMQLFLYVQLTLNHLIYKLFYCWSFYLKWIWKFNLKKILWLNWAFKYAKISL